MFSSLRRKNTSGSKENQNSSVGEEEDQFQDASEQQQTSQAGSESAAAPVDVEGADAEVLDDEPRSILLGLISQLSKGMDLHRVTLPTFVLEPRSMLERMTDFMSHPELLYAAVKCDDRVDRFIHVVRYYMSGWHIRPKGVKKPYNPVLGEFFRCRWTLPDDQSSAFYISEQVSHHPPISSFYYANPSRHVVIHGTFRPKSKFLGNSAASIMSGTSRILLTNRRTGSGEYDVETYTITMPNVYARGILFGTMVMELGDTVQVRCADTGLVADIEFKVKSFFGGTYNAIAGKIRDEKNNNQVLYQLSGKWCEAMHIQKCNASGKVDNTQPKQLLFDATQATILAKQVTSESEQDPYESRRLWSKLTKAMLSRNMDLATREKSAVEDYQRELAKQRATEKVEWQPRFFKGSGDDDTWRFIHHRLLKQDEDPSTLTRELEERIFTKSPPS